MKPQKTIMAFAWILALCMVLAACAAAPTTPANGENADDTSPEPNEQDAADLEKIDVTCETDPALSQTTVIITNNAGRTFTGDVVAYLYDESNAIVGREDLHVQDLLPGYYAGYVIDVTGTNDVEVRYHINDGYMFTGEAPADDQGSDGDTSTEDTDISTETDAQDAADLEKINVTYKVDQVLSQVIVFVTNNSSRIFTGDVIVYFYNSKNLVFYYDMLMVKALGPGNETYARINISETAGVTMTYEFSNDHTFVDAASASSGIVNRTESQKLTEDMFNGFGGAGHPEWAASWYSGIDKIEVYDTTDGQKYAVVTVNTADQDAIDSIGNCVFGNFSKTSGLAQVLVEDAAGNTLFTRSE